LIVNHTHSRGKQVHRHCFRSESDTFIDFVKARCEPAPLAARNEAESRKKWQVKYFASLTADSEQNRINFAPDLKQKKLDFTPDLKQKQ